MVSRIDLRYLSRHFAARRPALIIIVIFVASLYLLMQLTSGDTSLAETEHSKQMSARWVMLARESGCDPSKLDGPAAESGCNPNKLKYEDYIWIEKQAPGHLEEALQWALRRDRILHEQQ